MALQLNREFYDSMCEFVGFNPHEAQLEPIDALFEQKERFIAPIAGRRWGKTYQGSSLDAYGSSQKDSKGWIIAPTYDMTQRVWSYLVPMMRKLWGDKMQVSISRMMITTEWGASIQCKSADKPDSLVGEGLDWMHLDEPALYKHGKQIWQQMLRPALADREGHAWFTTTPRGHNWFYDLIHENESNPAADKIWWKQYPSHTNPHLKQEELDAIQASLDPVTYKQEILAQFVAFAGMVYELFDAERHVLSAAEAQRTAQHWERYLLVDPGLANPTAMLELAHNRVTEEDIVLRDHVASGMLFPDVLRLAKEWEPPGGWTDCICDVAGKQRSQETHYSFVSWMREHGGINFKHGTNRIIDGVNCVRSRLVGVDNKVRLWFSEDAKACIKAMLNYHYPENKIGEEPVKDNVHDHPMDALRYGITYLHRRRRSIGGVA